MDDPKIYIVLDEYIEANSIDELRAKAANLAQTTWERDCAWEAERLLRQPNPPTFAVSDLTVTEMWSNKLLAETHNKSTLFTTR